ncbi:Imm63 family immunity protein [Buttiauxella selenatireducens]|uniref:Imm63 family immunity protein n=1 Tax=Buttiauxella selenatireducens TaxID=3073902 RepID=A0ABY9S4R7_9ENTR|nr:Imm63 family immunity protein [Buttiauxella sp. R73]WMY72497.1 Imm63 family immunity protein [Buttiauxella sp. R73]
MKHIEELRAELLNIGERIGGGVRPNYYFFIPDKPDGMATPYLEIHGKEYHFIVNERGTEIARKVTLSDDEILYWFVECGVVGLATKYAAMNSSPEKRFRDVYFRKQYSLMLSIRPEWATRKRKEFTEILSA